MDISVIIVSWNVKDRLRENLRSLLASKNDISFEVIVVDNASSDGSAEMVKNEFPSVKLVANSENLGFAKACNQGIDASSGRHVLLLNPDMRVFPDTLAKMVVWLDRHPEAIVAGGKLVDETGKTVSHVRRFPRLADQLAVTLKLGRLFPRVLDGYLCSGFNYSKAAMVDSIRGSFFFINKFEYGKLSRGRLPLLDEGYFIWFEEVDFCRHIYELGGQVWYYPGARAVDYVGASFSQVGLRRKQGYFRTSMLRYFGKWHGPLPKAVLYLAWVVSGGIVFFATIWKRK